MDIYEPIRLYLQSIINEEEQEKQIDTLDKKCGIISSCYPPSEDYPDGFREVYQFPVKPKDLKFYSHVKF